MSTPVYKVFKDDRDRVKTYQNRVDSALVMQNEWRPKAEEMVNRYAMRHRGQYTPKGHHIKSTTALGVIDSMYSNLVAVDVSFLIENLAAGTPLQAKIAQKVVQDSWNENKAKKRTDKAVKDAALVSIGFTKTFYDYFEMDKDVARADEDIEADVESIFQEAEAAGLEPPTADMIPAILEANGRLTETVTEVVRERAVVEYVPWKEVGWDYNADSWDECRWVYQLMKFTRHDLLGDPEIIEFMGEGAEKKLAKMAADTVLDKKYRPDRDPTYDDELITCVQFWDLEAGDCVLFPLGGDFVLKKSENCFNFQDDLEDRNPFVPIIVRSDPDNVRGISDMEVLSYLLDEEEIYRSNLATIIERWKSKVFGPADALGPDGKTAMQSQEDGVYVPLEEAVGTDLTILYPPMPPTEAFGMLDRIKNEAREATGVNEFMRGLFSNKRTTATEVNAVDGHSSARHSEKLNALEQFYTAIAQRILWIAQRYYDEERVLRIAGIDPESDEIAQETIWEWSNEDIAAEMDLRVVLVPKEPITQQSRKELAMWALEVLPLVEGVDKQALVIWGAEEMGMDPKIVSRLIMTQAEMQQAQQAALQQQAAEVQAADGVIPDPASVAGPMSGGELAAAVNGGEIPAELTPHSASAPNEVPSQ